MKKTLILFFTFYSSIFHCFSQESFLSPCGPNLIYNGAFELGYTGFYSDYQPLDGNGSFGLCGGYYKLDNSALKHSGTDFDQTVWTTNKDHTTGIGNFLIGDAPCTVSDGAKLFEQTVKNLIIGETYVLTFWASNLSPDTTNLPIMGISIDGYEIAEQLILYNADNPWTKVLVNYVHSGIADSVKLAVQSEASVYGDDIGLDDISFYRSVVLNGNATYPLIVATCDSYLSPSGKYTYTQTGVYYDTLENVNACDSILEIDLTILESTESLIQIESCEEYYSESGVYYTETGIYTESFTNSVGCDSTLEIDLTILESSESFIEVNACEEYTSESGVLYQTSGLYYENFTSSFGCDSTLEIDLTILEKKESLVIIESCDLFISDTQITYETTGIYEENHTAKNGCDSLVVLDITINKSTIEHRTLQGCEKVYSDSETPYDQTGVFEEKFTSSLGCDSIISYSITIFEPTSVSIEQVGSELKVNPNDNLIQWLDCNDNLIPIDGENKATFTPKFNGNYAVEYTNENNCVDTAECINFVLSSVTSNINNDYNIWPNPFTDNFIIDYKGSINIKVCDILGKTILTVDNTREEINIDTQNWNKGIYFVQLIAANQNLRTFKVIKK
jgi:hypothetical protein